MPPRNTRRNGTNTLVPTAPVHTDNMQLDEQVVPDPVVQAPVVQAPVIPAASVAEIQLVVPVADPPAPVLSSSQIEQFQETLNAVMAKIQELDQDRTGKRIIHSGLPPNVLVDDLDPLQSTILSNNNHVRSPLSGRVPVLPPPSKLTHAFFKLVSEGLADVGTAIREILRWLRRHHFNVIEEFATFVEDHSVKKYIIEYFEALQANGQVLIDEDFITEVSRLVSGEVRSRVEVARAMLIGRAIKQFQDSAAKYAQRFYQCSRLLLDESQASLCLHYLAGLKPELQQACAVDLQGNSWTNLDNLVKFSYGEEIRLQAKSTSFHSSQSRPSRPFQGFQTAGRTGKVAVIKDQKRLRGSDEAGPSGLRSQRPCQLPVHKDNPAKKPKSPPEECPFFGKEGKLSEGAKMVLSEYGLCWYCRRGCHLARDCPNRTPQGPDDNHPHK